LDSLGLGRASLETRSPPISLNFRQPSRKTSRSSLLAKANFRLQPLHGGENIYRPVRLVFRTSTLLLRPGANREYHFQSVCLLGIRLWISGSAYSLTFI
jgi:hypothetical protein